MKNIQVIDDAMNATYDIFEASDEEFALIFPNDTDIAFVDDFFDRVGEKVAQATLEPIWSRRIQKADVQGIHGTLFYGLSYKKRFYPNMKDTD